MIKSSDNNINNAYRIIKLLTNQDYLAVDLNQKYYIFSSTKNIPLIAQKRQQSFSINRQYKYILHHRQIIYMDSFYYYVFEIDNKNIRWAKNLEYSNMSQQIYLFQLIKHAIKQILNDLVWMKMEDLNKFFDIRNYWIINQKLFVLSFQRQNKINFSIKRSENGISSKEKQPLKLLLNSQSKIIKRFMFILWQIIYKQKYQQTISKCNYTFIDFLMKKVIKQKISYQEILEIVNEEQLRLQLKSNSYKTHKKKYILAKKSRIKSQVSSKNRSIQTISKTVNSNISLIDFKIQNKEEKSSILNNGYMLKRKNNTILQNFKAHIFTPKKSMRNHSSIIQNKIISYNKPPKKYSHILNQEYQKSYINYIKKHKSLQICQKLQRQGKSAKQKYIKTISIQQQNNIQQTSKVNQIDMKEKILQKLRQFKQKRLNILKNNYILKNSAKNDFDNSRDKAVQNNEQQKILENDQQQKNNEKISRLVLQVDSNIKSQSSINETKMSCILNLASIKNQECKQSLQQQKQIQKQNPTVTNTSENSHNDVIKKQNLQRYQNKLILDKIEDKYINKAKINKMSVMNEIDDEIQQIKFVKQQIIADKKTENVKQPCVKKENDKNQILVNKLQNNSKRTQFEQINYQSINKFEELEIKKPPQILEKIKFLITLINVIGDICIKNLKQKSNHPKISWKKPLYLLYERFYYQRSRIYKNLINKQSLKVRNIYISPEQMTQWADSKQYQTFVTKINEQNVKILKTFNKFSEQLIKENKIEQKFLRYIKNRQKILIKDTKQIRIQLSKIILISLSENFDEIIKNKFNNKENIIQMIDLLFGLSIVAEFDQVLNKQSFVKLQNYKSYNLTLKQIDQKLDSIYECYFPQQKSLKLEPK